MPAVPLADHAPLASDGPQAARPVVAAFDLDGTITRTDCVIPFLRTVAGTSPLIGRLARHPGALAANTLRRRRDALKQLGAAAAFTGRTVADIDELARTFAADVVAGNLRADVRRDLDHHLAAGHRTAIVSASFAVYARLLGAALGVDEVLATELEVGPDGRYTGRLLGANCRGAEKVRRLHDWLDQHCGGRSGVELWAYGDSPGDHALITDADRPLWVGDDTVRGLRS